jgi:hypothetical protein
MFICIPAVTHLHVEKHLRKWLLGVYVYFDDPVIRQTSDIGNVHHKFLRDVAELKTKQNKIPFVVSLKFKNINYVQQPKIFAQRLICLKFTKFPTWIYSVRYVIYLHFYSAVLSIPPDPFLDRKLFA